MARDIEYSDKYCDDSFEYRHVVLPMTMKAEIPRDRLMKEKEWRSIGVIQSRGWKHYMIHKPEPHILLFRRPIKTNPKTGKAHPHWVVPDGLSPEEQQYWLTDEHFKRMHNSRMNNENSNHQNQADTRTH